MDFRNYNSSELTLELSNVAQSNLQCVVPPELQQNLYGKRVGIEELQLDTSQIPRFIPQVALTKNVYSVVNYRGGATTTNTQIPSAGGTNMNIDCLNYFINYRKKDNTECYTSFVMWTDPNNLPAPRVGLVDEISVYSMPYFFCYNFMDFLTMVQKSINVAIETVLNNPIPAGQESMFKYDASTKTYQLSVENNYVLDWDIEFSASLYELFRFQSVQVNVGYQDFVDNAPVTTYRIVWNDRFFVDETLYYNATCEVKNTILPFDLFMLTTNLPIQPTTFINSVDTNIDQATSFQILHKWRIHGNALEMQEYLNVRPENLVNRLKTLVSNSIGSQTLKFQLIVRTRREHEYIQWQVPLNEQLQISLATFTVV